MLLCMLPQDSILIQIELNVESILVNPSLFKYDLNPTKCRIPNNDYRLYKPDLLYLTHTQI